MEAAEVGGRERSHTFLTCDNAGGKKLRRLDHFNGVTYVNEVIAINSPLCGSLRAGLRAIRRGCPWTLAPEVLQEQVWDARGWAGRMGGVAWFWVVFFFFWLFF